MLRAAEVAVFVLATANSRNWRERALPSATTWGRDLPTYLVLEDTDSARYILEHTCKVMRAGHSLHRENAGASVSPNTMNIDTRSLKRSSRNTSATTSNETSSTLSHHGKRRHDAETVLYACSGAGGVGVSAEAGHFANSTDVYHSSRKNQINFTRRNGFNHWGQNSSDGVTGYIEDKEEDVVNSSKMIECGGNFEAVGMVAPGCTGEYHGPGPCCKCAYAVSFAHYRLPSLKWFAFLDDDVYVRWVPFLDSFSAYDSTIPSLLVTRSTHEWHGSKGRSCPDLPAIQVARAHPAVFSAAAISVLAPYTNHHLKHHRAVDAKNAGSSSESTSKHRRLVLSQPRQLTDSSPQSSQPPSPLHNAAEDPQVNTSKYSSKPMHPRSFTGICSDFGLSHDDGLGIWAWLHGVQFTQMPSHFYHAQLHGLDPSRWPALMGSKEKMTSSNSAASSPVHTAALLHRVRGVKEYPNMVDVHRYYSSGSVRLFRAEATASLRSSAFFSVGNASSQNTATNTIAAATSGALVEHPNESSSTAEAVSSESTLSYRINWLAECVRQGSAARPLVKGHSHERH